MNSEHSKNYKKKQQRPAIDLDTMVYGKVPPQAKKAEMAVLGAIMLESFALAEVLDILAPEKFYLESHQHVYRAILNLDAKGQKVDLITVVLELTRMEKLEDVGGDYYITKLTDEVVSSANIVDHARAVAQKWMAREVIRAGGEMIQDGYDDSTDPFELLDRSEQALARIMDSNDRGKITPIDVALARSAQRLAVLRQQDSSMTGVPAGFDALDKITHGWQSTDLIILAARPAVGKTAFALNLARNAALDPFKPVPVAFFSLEMSESQLIERLVSSESGVLLDMIKTGRLDDGQMDYVFEHGYNKLAKAPIFIDDTPALNIFELRAKCRRLKTKHHVGFIIIDYLQLMSGTAEKGNREQEISRISRDLKSLAKELQVPIIALSQLSRAVEGRTDKTPQLSDLRESGAIEQDADMVMFLYRPEYYGIKVDENGASSRGETHVKIAKHRNGSLDTIKLTAKLETQKFVDFEGESLAPVTSNPWRPAKNFYEKDDTAF
jgi:replicative DNA helicase